MDQPTTIKYDEKNEVIDVNGLKFSTEYFHALSALQASRGQWMRHSFDPERKTIIMEQPDPTRQAAMDAAAFGAQHTSTPATSKICTQHEFGEALIEALGIGSNPDGSRRAICEISLRVNARRLPQLTVTEEVTECQAERISAVIRQYELHPRQLKNDN